MTETAKNYHEQMQNDALHGMDGAQRQRHDMPPMPDYVRPLSSRQVRQDFQPTEQPRQPTSAPTTVDQQPNRSSLPESQPVRRTKSTGLGFLDKLNLANFDIDSDRSLILMMMALLGKETVDETLMLALLYIML